MWGMRAVRAMQVLRLMRGGRPQAVRGGRAALRGKSVFVEKSL